MSIELAAIPQLRSQHIDIPFLAELGTKLEILRVDEVHPLISGNKWYKLKYNLLQARAEGHQRLLSFGGAFSNHIYALAAAGKAYGFQTIGVIRGEKAEPLNATLSFAEAQGMQLHFISREAYRHKADYLFLQELLQRLGPCYLIPEGGSNTLAVKGCCEIIARPDDYDYIACCVGTGGTLAGILEKTQKRTKVLGFAALKGGDFLYEEVNRLTSAFSGSIYDNYKIVTDYHFGGYAKATPVLVGFINDFKKEHKILLDPIYTGKMMYGLLDMAKQGFFKSGSRILAVHSGGLQGISGFNERYAKKNLQIFVD
ncbi:MAG: 1-aminocyclopropane-1-carboxylate deaminase/D-cysteine desulfhydrase [Cyclobacteriaceae bacterium]